MKGREVDFFEKRSQGQRPDYRYIGSDGRVLANEIEGMQPEDVFVHRNIANMVNNTDMNVMSVINYATVHLNVKHIIVCGHYNCSGVKAAMQAKEMGIINLWLRGIRDVYQLHMAELDAIKHEYERYTRLVELNVREQAINVIKTANVQKLYLKQGFPVVHGWVFDLKTGLLKVLEIGFASIL